MGMNLLLNLNMIHFSRTIFSSFQVVNPYALAPRYDIDFYNSFLRDDEYLEFKVDLKFETKKFKMPSGKSLKRDPNFTAKPLKWP